MQKFFYIARDKTGKKIANTEEASTEDDLINTLQARDLLVISVIPASLGPLHGSVEAISVKIKFKPKHYGIRGDDLVLFCRQLATLLGAGVTILKSLDIISQQVSSTKLLKVTISFSGNLHSD